MMARHGKRWRALTAQLEPLKLYSFLEAIELLQKNSTVKFEESVDAGVRLGIDPKKSEQAVRGSSQLPHGTGKTVKIAVFAQGELADAARKAGADLVGHEDLAASFKSGKVECDCVIATPDCMPLVGSLGRILGPRGLMPNPKVGTVTADVTTGVNNARKGQVRFRSDRGGIVHCLIGRASFAPQALKENLETLLSDLMKLKPSSAQGTYLRKISISTTMGPGLTVDPSSLAL